MQGDVPVRRYQRQKLAARHGKGRIFQPGQMLQPYETPVQTHRPRCCLRAVHKILPIAEVEKQNDKFEFVRLILWVSLMYLRKKKKY